MSPQDTGHLPYEVTESAVPNSYHFYSILMAILPCHRFVVDQLANSEYISCWSKRLLRYPPFWYLWNTNCRSHMDLPKAEKAPCLQFLDFAVRTLWLMQGYRPQVMNYPGLPRRGKSYIYAKASDITRRFLQPCAQVDLRWWRTRVFRDLWPILLYSH